MRRAVSVTSPVTLAGTVNRYMPSASAVAPARRVGILTVAPASGAPPTAAVTFPVTVVASSADGTAGHRPSSTSPLVRMERTTDRSVVMDIPLDHRLHWFRPPSRRSPGRGLHEQGNTGGRPTTARICARPGRELRRGTARARCSSRYPTPVPDWKTHGDGRLSLTRETPDGRTSEHTRSTAKRKARRRRAIQAAADGPHNGT